jgi:PAS domain S-box-containing protein
LKSANKQLASANDLIARQSELLVKQREEKLNDILSTIQDVVWSASFSDRELLFINEAAWQVFGYSQEELYQESRILEQIVYSHDKKRLEKAFKELIDKGYVHAEYRIVHKSGIIRWIRNQVWLKNEPLSQTATMDGVVTDITERKNYEAELQKRERLLNSLIESQTNYLIRTDIEGRYTFANQQFLQKFSFLPEEIIGQPFSKTVIPEDVDNCQAMALECIHNPGKIVSLIIRKPDKAEGIFWTEWEFIGIQDETGKVVEIQGVGQDVTEKKKSEERLEESNQALKHAQQIAQIGNWEFDLPTGKITWSDQVFTIHQVSKDEGEPSLEKLFTLYHPDDIPVLQASVRALIEQAIPYNLDMRIIGPSSQEIIYVNVIGKPIKDKAGKVKRIYGTLLNINERKLFEKSLQHQNEQLKKINSELDKFVYSVSHSLRAPLTSVLGLINVIRIDKVDPQVNIYLGLIEKSILKLDETIQEINDYSRNARFGLNIREVDLQKLLQDIIEPYTSADRAAKIKIETSFQAAFPFYSDAERLKVVINNLLSNAVRYYDEAKACPLVMIRINITPEEAFIEVEDNGIGIDSQLTDKIFNMFFRASEKSTGSGLGLYIVKETVDKLKGNITVASEPGKGSMFTVQLANMHS